MKNYLHDIPTKIYFGKGAIENLPTALSPFGKNVLLAYGGGSIKRSGLYDEVMTILKREGCKVSELAGIEPNPRVTSVEKGVELCIANSVDVILAVGGGSTIDCAKAIACGVYWKGMGIWEMCSHKHGLMKALPLVDILTLSATGSEFDGGAVISNLATNEKIGNSYTSPYVSICDPTYTFTVSKYQTAAGSADIMSHIFEGYFSRTMDCDLSDGIAETILKSTMKNCMIALKEPDNYAARANLMVNSSIACSGIPEYGKTRSGWICHGLEHELSAYYDITHGTGLAILTPRWMRHVLNKDHSVLDRFLKFANNVMGIEGNDMETAFKAIDALEDYFRSTGLPMTLSELGIGEEHFVDMVNHVEKRLDNQFVPLDKEDAIAIYKACL